MAIKQALKRPNTAHIIFLDVSFAKTMTDIQTDFITDFVEHLKAKEASAKTIINYVADVRHFAKWFQDSNGQRLALKEITRTDLRDYRSHLLTVEQRKPATINRRLTTLRRLCAWAKREHLVEENPAEDVKGVERVKLAPRALEKREVDRLIRFAERDGNKRNLAIVNVLRHTGIRVGELCSLRLGDVEISERKGMITVRSGKGGKQREVPLNLDARKTLSACLEMRPDVDDDHVFIGQRDQPMTPSGAYDVVVKYARMAGLSDVSPHILRHTFGKTTLDAGEELVTVAALMGHSSLDTTAIYTQPSQHDLERAVERLETT